MGILIATFTVDRRQLRHAVAILSIYIVNSRVRKCCRKTSGCASSYLSLEMETTQLVDSLRNAHFIVCTMLTNEIFRLIVCFIKQCFDVSNTFHVKYNSIADDSMISVVIIFFFLRLRSTLLGDIHHPLI